VVIYDADRCLGGAVISAAQDAALEAAGAALRRTG